MFFNSVVIQMADCKCGKLIWDELVPGLAQRYRVIYSGSYFQARMFNGFLQGFVQLLPYRVKTFIIKNIPCYIGFYL